MSHGKKYKEASKFIDAEKTYDIKEAVELLEKTNYVKFDPTVEIHFKLGIDPKHADQLVRSTITLPHGTGKSVKIWAFTDSGNEKALISGGATIAWGEDLIDQIAKWGDINFDIAIASPGMMRHMGKVAKILGPKGLMPNPKAGTVGEDLESILKELQGGRFEFKNDKQGNLHSVIGKLSFWVDKLTENLEFFLNAVKEAKPSGVKNAANYIHSITICNAMGPGIKIDYK